MNRMKNVLATLVIMSLLFTNCKDKKAQNPVDEVYEETQKEQPTLQHSLEFTAFKTPEKKGVKGTFTEITLDKIKKKDSLHSMLQGATFTVNTKTVSTGDASRDEKLKTIFFGNLNNSDITGTFESFYGTKAKVVINMNDLSKPYEFEFTEYADSIIIIGSIDYVNDFKATKSFELLHAACKELHMNKTWTDVALKVVVKK